MIENLHPAEFAVGLALGLGSHSLGRHPAVADKLGTTDSIVRKPTLWTPALHKASHRSFGRWVEHPGLKDGTKRPADYPEVAVMSFNKAPVDAILREGGARQAGSYVLKKSVVIIGTSEYISIFGNDPADETRYALGMRIGDGLFKAQPVLAARWGVCIALPENAELTETFMKIDQVDPTIPII